MENKTNKQTKHGGTMWNASTWRAQSYAESLPFERFHDLKVGDEKVTF